MLSFFVAGIPKTKGHLVARHTWKANHKCSVWLTDAGGEELAWWMSQVTGAGRAAMNGEKPLEGKVYLGCSFYFPPSAVLFGGHRNDVDTLTRAVMDALDNAKVYNDDSQVSQLAITKGYMDHMHPAGAAILVDVQG